MITVKNKFEDGNLSIQFSGSSIENNSMLINIQNDVNFKSLVDFLIQLIPNKEKLNFNFESFEKVEEFDKLTLIKETTEEIFNKFNLAIDGQEDQIIDTTEDLPF